MRNPNDAANADAVNDAAAANAAAANAAANDAAANTAAANDAAANAAAVNDAAAANAAAVNDAAANPDASEEARADADDVNPIEHMLSALRSGVDWPTAMLQAMAYWRAPQETIDGNERNYFIGGEAFDWLLMAERLCDAAGDLIPADEQEALLFDGRFPDSFDAAQFKELLGAHKHSGYLNYFYGVVVEEALQLAVEGEVHKRHISNGNRYQSDFSEEAFARIYHKSHNELLAAFRGDMGYPEADALTLTQSKEFTYWLFKYRVRTSDKARVASDTRKGLAQLQALAAARNHTPLMD